MQGSMQKSSIRVLYLQLSMILPESDESTCYTVESVTNDTMRLS